MRITLADMSQPDLQELLKLHLEAAQKQGASAVFSTQRLAASDIFFFEARDNDGSLLGFAGLKLLDTTHGEVKSVRTHPEHLRKGVSRQLMNHLTQYARQLGLKRLSLETHPTQAYIAARTLYEHLGYMYCEPFGDYVDTETSVYMTKQI